MRSSDTASLSEGSLRGVRDAGPPAFGCVLSLGAELFEAAIENTTYRSSRRLDYSARGHAAVNAVYPTGDPRTQRRLTEARPRERFCPLAPSRPSGYRPVGTAEIVLWSLPRRRARALAT
jgi:hypothetical protein